MRRLDPGEVVALGLVAQALAVDVALIRRGKEPISTVVRRSRSGRVVTVYLAIHLTRSFAWDPLSLIAQRIERRESA